MKRILCPTMPRLVNHVKRYTRLCFDLAAGGTYNAATPLVYEKHAKESRRPRAATGPARGRANRCVFVGERGKPLPVVSPGRRVARLGL